MSTAQKIDAMRIEAGQAGDMEQVEICRVAIELLDCYGEARRQGFVGDISEWEATRQDCESIADALGHEPTRAQYAEAMRLVRASEGR